MYSYWAVFLFNLVASDQSATLPVIKFYNQVKATNYILNGTNVLEVNDFDRCLLIKCFAKYPIKWNISGYITPVNFISLDLPASRQILNSEFAISMMIDECNLEKKYDTKVSLEVKCESLERPEIQAKFLMYGGRNYNETLIKPVSTTVYDSKIISCPTLDPITPVSLYRKEKERLVYIHQDHIPTIGFVSTDVYEGEYICQQLSSSVHITALKSPALKSNDFNFAPSLTFLRVFKGETLKLKCVSKQGNHVYIEIDEANFRVARFGSDSSRNVDIKLRLNFKDVSNITGKATCMARLKNSSTNVEIVKWTFEFLEPPKFLINNTEHRIHCLSKFPSITLQSYACINSMDCAFRHSLSTKLIHDFAVTKRTANADTQKFTTSSCERGFYCVSIPPFMTGLVVCSFLGLSREWETIAALDTTIYTDWQNAPQQQLVSIDPVNETLYTNETTLFVCKAVLKLFGRVLSFVIEFENGSIEHRPSDDVDYNMFADVNKFYKAYAILHVNLSISAVRVHCIALWWNSTATLNATSTFRTKHLLIPKIAKGKSSTNTEHFFTGEQNRRLTCNVTGEPKPIYTWYFNSTEVSHIFPNLKTSLGSSGEAYLEFLEEIGYQHDGEYSCVAENRVGRTSVSFHVSVSDEQVSIGPLLTAVIFGAVSLSAIILGIIIVIRKKRRESNERYRDLSQEEIDQFFMGNPNLIGNKSTENQEDIEFLPFNKKYEIPLNDLKFDCADKNLIGSGEFAFVVRALMLSTGKPVALKVPRPSSDINQFLALLSEIKIMSFVGEHPNVVTLIGACTEGIQIRSVYIATEICELGNLSSFLRKSKPSFVDLMSENEINFEPITVPLDSLTNLDLISFSAQIAKGMEYLAYKLVVHADLAARNVLLTKEKVAKISDFGLSKKLYDRSYYRKKSKSQLPWRWMALECLTSLTFSVSSDVWAYGVTLYEIFSLGEVPFPNETWNKEFVARLEGGMRMGRPNYSTQEIYFKMCICWEKQPHLRPDFTSLRSYFEEIYHALSQKPHPALNVDDDSLASSPSSECIHTNYTSLYE